MLFSNTFDSNYEELITYYPRFYREVKEMVAILSAEGTLADDVMSGMEKGFANAFVSEADADMIARYEAFIGIEADESQTLEERRTTVLSYFAGFGQMSASVIKAILEIYTDGETEVLFEPADEEGNNLLRIITDRGTYDNFSALDILNLIARRLPAHIWHGLEVAYSEKANLYFGLASVLLVDMELGANTEQEIEDIDYLIDENGDTLIDEVYNVIGDGDES